MKRRHVKIFSIVFVLCVFISLFMISVYKDNSSKEFYYNVTYFNYNKVPNVSMSSDVPEKIDSLEQLTEFCLEAKIAIDDKESWDYDSDFYKKFRSYDKKFFKNKSLIVICKTHGAGFWNYEFGNLKIEDDNLIIGIHNISYELDDGSYDMPAIYTQYLWVIEINKDLINDINQITIQNYGKIK